MAASDSSRLGHLLWGSTWGVIGGLAAAVVVGPFVHPPNPLIAVALSVLVTPSCLTYRMLSSDAGWNRTRHLAFWAINVVFALVLFVVLPWLLGVPNDLNGGAIRLMIGMHVLILPADLGAYVAQLVYDRYYFFLQQDARQGFEVVLPEAHLDETANTQNQTESREGE